jgi:hypothetical protein
MTKAMVFVGGPHFEPTHRRTHLQKRDVADDRSTWEHHIPTRSIPCTKLGPLRAAF